MTVKVGFGIFVGTLLLGSALIATSQTPPAQAPPSQAPPGQAAPATTTTTTTVHRGGIAVLVDGKPVEFKEAPPQVIMGCTMVPMRGIFEAIGAYVEYDPANHTVKAQRNNESVELRMGSRLAHKNGAEILMEVKPTVIAGTTMVPLRFIGEALGATVEFDKPNNRVMVTTSE